MCVCVCCCCLQVCTWCWVMISIVIIHLIFNTKVSQRQPGAAFLGPKNQLCLPYSQNSAQLLSTYSPVIKVITSSPHMDSDIAILNVEACMSKPWVNKDVVTFDLWRLRSEWIPGWPFIPLCVGELAAQKHNCYKSNFKRAQIHSQRHYVKFERAFEKCCTEPLVYQPVLLLSCQRSGWSQQKTHLALLCLSHTQPSVTRTRHYSVKKWEVD